MTYDSRDDNGDEDNIPIDISDADALSDDLANLATEDEADEALKELVEQQKSKNQQVLNRVTFSLKSRRAIEEHLEKIKLRRELDYLLDENDNTVDKTKEP